MVEEKQMSFMCRGCSDVFFIPSRRGRPPAFCSTCKPELSVGTITGRLSTSNPVFQNIVPVMPKQVGTIVSTERELVGSKSFSVLNGKRMMNLFCDSCTNVFAIPARRGRPPKYCSLCIDSGKAQTYEEQRIESSVAKARERVDNLEMLLRSRGTHISQQKDWL